MADYRLTKTGDEVQQILNTATPQSDLTAETQRATSAEQVLQSNINSEAEARQGADAALQQNIDAEQTRAEAAEQQLQGNIDDEQARAEAAEQQLDGRVDDIEELIPATATPQNQMADKAFVNSSIATATAEFRGAYNEVNDLHLDVTATRLQIAAALPNVIATADNNDYCYVQIPTSDATPSQIASVERYKFDGSQWSFEYALNNSGFTAEQWAAVNSGITSGLVAKLSALPSADTLAVSLAALNTAIGNETAARITDVNDEEARAKAAELTLSGSIQSEQSRAQAAEQTLGGDIDTEETRAQAAEQQLGGRITTIEGKIPVAASAQNKLVDEAFVSSSIATATATYKGSFNEVSDLHLTTAATRTEIATELAAVIATADNNDYCYVQIPTADATPAEIARVERYKYNGTQWGFEYELNNSGFTAGQWAALNSGITSGLVAKLNGLPTAAELTTLFGGKQDVIADLAAIRSGAAAGATAVQPATLESAVGELEAADNAEQQRAEAAEAAIAGKIPAAASPQNQLVDAAALAQQMAGKQNVIADLGDIRSGAAAGATAYQKPAAGIPETDLSTALQLALASFITASAQNLAYYYLKSETYSASQIDQMLAAIKQFRYESVQTLPTASAQTVGIIYLVPSPDPHTQNVKDEYITLTITEESTTSYVWEKIGTTALDLSNYYTKSQTDVAITAALNTALTAYSTTSQVSTMISTAINSALQAYATKEYVSGQVQEYAGTFRGTYDSLAELEATTGNHHNDYAWVKVTDSDGDNDYDRHKYNGSEWVFEYRLNNTHFTADELAAIRSGMTTAKREKLDALPTKTELTTMLNALTRHTRLTDFDLDVLKQAVADQNLEKYGLKVGDQKTINGHTYVIAGLNCMKGTHQYTCTVNHVGLILIPHTTQAWNVSGNTYTGADSRGAGYKNSDLHYYLKNTVLPMANTDLGSANLLAHSKLLSTAVNQSGVNRFGEATGCSSSWDWEHDCKICALSEMQVYGGTIWSSSGYDTGEADQQLEVFSKFKHTEIFGGEYPWLRDVVSASYAALADDSGYATYYTASYAYYVAALILFH